MVVSPRDAMEKLAVKPPPKFNVGDLASLGSTQFYKIEQRKWVKPKASEHWPNQSGWAYQLEGYGGWWKEEKLVPAQGELFPTSKLSKPKPSKTLPKQSQPIPVTTEPKFFVGQTVKSNATGILYIVTNKDWSPTFKEWVYQLNDFKGKATEWPIRERYLMEPMLPPGTQASRTASIITKQDAKGRIIGAYCTDCDWVVKGTPKNVVIQSTGHRCPASPKWKKVPTGNDPNYPRMGKVVATVPPDTKINQPKDRFPGDQQADPFEFELDYFKPFGGPGAKGPARELDRRAPNIGVPKDPMRPHPETDDTDRRKDVPPIFDTNKQGAKIPVRLMLDVTGYSRGETFGFVNAYVEGKPFPIGRLSWSELHDEVHILMIEVGKEYQRQGIAADLMQKLREEFPTAKIDPGLLTEEGSKFYHSADPKTGAEEKGVFATPDPNSIGDPAHPPIGNLRAEKKVAIDIAPIPKTKVEMTGESPMVLEVPRDLRDRYQDLHRRVYDYAQTVAGHLGSLDAYKYRNSPPREWVLRELPNAKPNWDDNAAVGRFFNRMDHSEIAEWADFKNTDPATISSDLHTSWAVSAGGADFHKWFKKTKPAIRRDESLVTFLRDRGREHPQIKQDYDAWWRKRYLGQVYGQAYRIAKEKWQEYVRNSGSEFAKEEYREVLEMLNQAGKGEKVPLSDLIDSMHKLPFEGEYKTDVDTYHSELGEIVDSGMHSLDLAAPPVSRDDRLSGDLSAEGTCWIPVRRIESGLMKSVEESPGPIRLYRYGAQYFPVDGTDAQKIAAADSMYVEAEVTNVVPGSSIRKQYAMTPADFQRKSKCLSNAIHEVEAGVDKEAVFMKYGREYGPDLRRAVDDYLYVQTMHKDANEGLEENSRTCTTFLRGQTHEACNGCPFYLGFGGKKKAYTDSAGGNTNNEGTNLEDQTPDDQYGATFNVGTGGREYGYGGCALTDLFLNAPDPGFGRGDPSAYDPDHTPATPSRQRPQKDDRPSERGRWSSKEAGRREDYLKSLGVSDEVIQYISTQNENIQQHLVDEARGNPQITVADLQPAKGVTSITSFGFKYGKPEATHDSLVLDVRESFLRNPYHDKALRHLRGDDPQVIEDIQKTPHFADHYNVLKNVVSRHNGPVYLGCTGGHHRSVYLTNRLGQELGVPVAHRDYDKDAKREQPAWMERYDKNRKDKLRQKRRSINPREEMERYAKK